MSRKLHAAEESARRHGQTDEWGTPTEHGESANDWPTPPAGARPMTPSLRRNEWRRLSSAADSAKRNQSCREFGKAQFVPCAIKPGDYRTCCWISTLTSGR